MCTTLDQNDVRYTIPEHKILFDPVKHDQIKMILTPLLGTPFGPKRRLSRPNFQFGFNLI